MKKFNYLIIFYLSLLFNFAYSQNNFSTTTEEEYNYLTKGYKIQIESGLDMKKGYILENILIQKIDSYDFDIKYLKKTDTNKYVSIFIIVKSNVSGNTYYLSIPFNNKNLLNKYYESINSLDERLTTALCIAISNISAMQINK